MIFVNIGDLRIHFKAKVTLILCFFSGSDIGSNWWLLFIITSNNKTPQLLNLRHLVLPCTRVDTMAVRLFTVHSVSLLTQCESKVRRPCQSIIVGGACSELHHSDRNLRTVWFERGDFKIGNKKKNTWWVFIYIGWMWTHTSNTHFCSNNLKSEFCIRWPV